MTIPYRVVLASGLAAALVLSLAVLFSIRGSAEARGVALEELPMLYAEQNKALGAVVVGAYHEYRANATRWSGVYFSCVFGSAFLSALAAIVLKLESLQSWPRFRNDFAASVAVLAALLTTLSTTGDFQRKWQANRLAASGMENLAYTLVSAKSDEDRNEIIKAIQAINTARNNGIVGENTAPTAPKLQ